jgi:aminopeptidase N
MKKQDHKLAPEFIKMALNDKYAGLRNATINKLDLKKKKVLEVAETILVDIIKNEKDRLTKAAAIEKLGTLKKKEYAVLYIPYLEDSSYTLSGAALSDLYDIEPSIALESAKKQISPNLQGALLESITSILINSGDISSFSTILKIYEKMPLSQSKLNLTGQFSELLAMISEETLFNQGVDAVISFRKSIPSQYQMSPVINNILKGVIGKKETAKKQGGDAVLLDKQIDYIKSKISTE